MMRAKNYMTKYCIDFIHELEDGSLSDVLSEYKIMFMSQDDLTVDELINKVKEIGIEIIGDVDIELDNFDNGHTAVNFVTISTDTDIDDELYAELYEYSKRNGFDVTFYVHNETVATVIDGVIAKPYYRELEMDSVEADVWMKMLKEDDPEEWARIQAENVS